MKKVIERVPNFSEGRRREVVDLLAEAQTHESGLDEFLSSVAEISPLLPGGGSVAALAGSLAAALGEMMSSLTEGRKKFAVVDSLVREIHAKLTKFRDVLRRLIDEDSKAFGSVMDAIHLPKENEEQKAARGEAIEKATRTATEIPLSIARASAGVLECMRLLVEIGNPNARGDAAVGAQLAYASLKGAQYNVICNIPGLKDKAFAEGCRTEVLDLVQKGQAILSQVDRLVTGSGQP